MINGNVYGFSDINLNVSGTPVAGFIAINYKETQVIEPIYGAGKKPIGMGHGNVTFTGNVTLLKEEVDSLVNAIPSGRLQDYPPFPIIVTILPEGGTVFSTHKLLYCKFKDNGIDSKQGDTSFSTQIELFIGDIKWK